MAHHGSFPKRRRRSASRRGWASITTPSWRTSAIPPRRFRISVRGRSSETANDSPSLREGVGGRVRRRLALTIPFPHLPQGEGCLFLARRATTWQVTRRTFPVREQTLYSDRHG